MRLKLLFCSPALALVLASCDHSECDCAPPRAAPDTPACAQAPVVSSPHENGSGIRVLAAKAEVNLVMLSAGSTQGVKPGNHFRALHCGKFVGTVQVDKVWPDMCSARVILQPKSEEGFPIKKGDSAVPLTEPEPQAFKTKVIAISADKDKVTLAAGSKDVALRSCFGILHDNMVIAFAVVQGIGADTCSAKLLPMNSDKIVVGDGAICVDELNTWEHGFLLERILQSAAEKTGSK